MIECGPCSVVRARRLIKTATKLQLGYVELKEARKDTKIARGATGRRGARRSQRPVARPLEKKPAAPPDAPPGRVQMSGEGDEPASRQQPDVEALFKAGDAIKVQGTSKGRGVRGV